MPVQERIVKLLVQPLATKKRRQHSMSKVLHAGACAENKIPIWDAITRSVQKTTYSVSLEITDEYE